MLSLGNEDIIDTYLKVPKIVFVLTVAGTKTIFSLGSKILQGNMATPFVLRPMIKAPRFYSITYTRLTDTTIK